MASASIRHVLYRRDRPFHPQRIGLLLSDGHASTV
eukprot:COSAG01_NODE_41774_length_447_cov_1.316092_2_plen_34_part_01